MLLCYSRMNEFFPEWDSKKATSNVAKHGVTFEEAQTVLHDDDALMIPDPDHSKDEERFIIMGQSSGPRMLVVVATDFLKFVSQA